MGLFDKRDRGKRKGGGSSDEFDSPVEKIDLSAEPVAEPKPRAKPAAEPGQQPAKAKAKPAPEAEEDDDYDPPAYGINKAIELMRSLPPDNVELVVQVVKHTLESTKIKISAIIEDATRKQADIQGRIKVLNGEISEFEQEITTRKQEIDTLEADYSETTTVKERLVLAENLTKKEKEKETAAAEPPKPAGVKNPLGAAPAPARPGAIASPLTKNPSPLGKKPTIVAKK